ncbi:hypothetical protein ABPG75_006710 [Micractinium tetrahymenae]
MLKMLEGGAQGEQCAGCTVGMQVARCLGTAVGLGRRRCGGLDGDAHVQWLPQKLIAALESQLALLKVCRGANCQVRNINLLADAAEALQQAVAPESVLQL